MTKNILLTLLFTVASAYLFAQTPHSVNIGPNLGIGDSSIVVQTGTIDSFHIGNHPGFGGYSNGEIYICENATLKYNYTVGTSSNPKFYLAKGAKLIVYGSFIASNAYMKANSSIECIGGNFTAEQLRRELPTILSSAGGSFFDSIQSVLTYTYTGWPNAANPCNIAADVSNQLIQIGTTVYPNPVNNKLIIKTDNNSNQNYLLRVYDITGSIQLQQAAKKMSENILLDVSKFRAGNYYMELQLEGTAPQIIRFSKED
jgi:hypothetical protein